jgi:hypothetical protein
MKRYLKRDEILGLIAECDAALTEALGRFSVSMFLVLLSLFYFFWALFIHVSVMTCAICGGCARLVDVCSQQTSRVRLLRNVVCGMHSHAFLSHYFMPVSSECRRASWSHGRPFDFLCKFGITEILWRMYGHPFSFWMCIAI